MVRAFFHGEEGQGPAAYADHAGRYCASNRYGRQS